MADLGFVKRQPVLRAAPLELAICQVRFPRQIGLSDSDIRPIQLALAKSFPQVQVGRSANFELGPEGVREQDSPQAIYQFLSVDRAWTVTVTAESFSLETTAYHDFSDFLARWIAASGVVVDAIGIASQTRIGLRYVNRLACPERPTPADLAKIVRPELVGVVGANELLSRLRMSMQELRFEQDRGTCTLRHGLVPDSDAADRYILDLDFYDDTSAVFDVDAQSRLLADFNHSTFELFKWCVQKDHFLTFRPEEPSDA
ncbi:TIGR04255 family protein [Conexibacter stalactiti]|uniref:TIGR04255 family protein n=1 Tax=Conexibacter stalactiti TaxID=1940611 RepID=A0ABU4HQS9_9ACTN|nr:TIGR04255 family protein [Conexibacter stalactiti]MDW5595109.1 TIGR04255 family protein [Conexibacter stalactiti]MEC5035751.1 TIGR04255 family protein [Conexibacter stalactiti]